MNTKEITIEVAYATPDVQIIESIKIIEGNTVEQAIKISGILLKLPEINLQFNKVGVFGKLCSLDKSLKHLDRVEIYRALISDPKEVRKQRAKVGKRIKRRCKNTASKLLADN